MAKVKKTLDPIVKQKKLLITAIKKTINKNASLSILEYVYLDGKEAIVTDLETSVRIPFECGLSEPVCVPASKLISIMEIIEEPKFSVPTPLTLMISGGTRKIEVCTEDPLQFPKIPPDNEPLFIGTLGEAELGYLAIAVCFTSDDKLRRVMTGVNFGKKELAATDAHRLYHKEYEKPLEQDFVMPKKSAGVILAMGGTHIEVFASDDYIGFKNEDGVQVWFRHIDAKFPNYPVVIPERKDAWAIMYTHKDLLLEELKNAGKFANKSTNGVLFYLNGNVTISSNDPDFKESYENILDYVEFQFNKKVAGVYKINLYDGQVLKCKTFNHEYEADTPVSIFRELEDGTIEVRSVYNVGYKYIVNKDQLEPLPMTLRIMFNGNFLKEVITKIPNDEAIEFVFHGPTKAAIINKDFLVMPLLLNQ